MSFEIFNLSISIITLLIISYVLYLLLTHKNENGGLQELVKPPSNLLKPWVKHEKRKPKINDDNSAWQRENNP